jgi:hypothetical protein
MSIPLEIGVDRVGLNNSAYKLVLTASFSVDDRGVVGEIGETCVNKNTILSIVNQGNGFEGYIDTNS